MFLVALLLVATPSLATPTFDYHTPASNAARVDYTGHKVVSVLPQTKEQLDVLLALRAAHPDVDFWSAPRQHGHPVLVRVAPDAQSDFRSALKNFLVKDVIANLQEAIDAEAAQNEKKRWKRDASGNASGATSGNASGAADVVGRYARVPEIHAWLDEMAAKFPQLAKTFVMGKSFEGRELKGIVIGETQDKSKPVVWIQAGIHAREWIAPATCVYIIHHLLTSYHSNAEPCDDCTDVKALVDGVTWYLTPTINPDGYEFSHVTDRMWRKNRTPNNGSECNGTDGNRNWDDHWGLVGASKDPCDSTYQGTRPFSEPNTQAVSNYILAMKDRLKVFYAFHSYGNFWLTSWGWTDAEDPEDHEDIQRVAKGAVAALKARHGTDYAFGPAGRLLYPASGAEDDWAKGQAGVKYSFTLELPGDNFMMDVADILPTAEELWSGIEWVAKDVLLKK